MEELQNNIYDLQTQEPRGVPISDVREAVRCFTEAIQKVALALDQEKRQNKALKDELNKNIMAMEELRSIVRQMQSKITSLIEITATQCYKAINVETPSELGNMIHKLPIGDYMVNFRKGVDTAQLEKLIEEKQSGHKKVYENDIASVQGLMDALNKGSYGVHLYIGDNRAYLTYPSYIELGIEHKEAYTGTNIATYNIEEKKWES